LLIKQENNSMASPKFEKGVSGNPNGRPKNTNTAIFRNQLIEATPGIIDRLIAMALEGDTMAIKAVLDRVCPSLKPQAMAISLPVKSTLAEQGGAIIKATMAGQIPPDIGGQLITALANQSKIVEIDDLTRRLEALEAKK
jgi:Family of unknown function (DUF5681)